MYTIQQQIFLILTCSASNINLDIFWILWNNNKEVDKLSKEIDYDDWYITLELVNMLSQKWGKISVDRFVSDKNSKCLRFNSKFLCPNTEIVNAFLSDWSNENNPLVPPIFLIPKAIKCFLAYESSSRAILVCPYWVSATFWPLFLQNQIHFHLFVEDFQIIKDVQRCVKLGDNKNSYIGLEKFKGVFIAFPLVK